MKEKLNIIFSKYIRLRDTDAYGFGNCCTCKRLSHYDILECGHFRKRRHLAVCWDERNAHAQCHECNVRDDAVDYMIFMLGEYGVDIAQDIIEKSHVPAKFSKQDYEEMYQYFHGKIKELLKDKMFTIKY